MESLPTTFINGNNCLHTVKSDRLQELLQQFNACLDLTEDDTAPLALIPASTLEPSQRTTTNSLLPSNAQAMESISIATVLEPLLVSALAIAQERNLELQAEIPTELPLVKGNATALREVLSNLIDNALKYTPAGGQINIRVEDKPQTSHGEMIAKASSRSAAPLTQERLAIAISDTGPGIPPQDLEHLFERHYRGVQAATGIPGTGLGLAIAKELIEQMQGEIEVFSPAQRVWAKQNSESTTSNAQDNPAKGTTFVVWLLVVSSQ